MKSSILVAAGAALITSFSAHAEPFSGEAELGWVSTSGNSESDNLTFKAKANKSYGKVSHHVVLEALNSSNTSAGVKNRSAERYLFNYKADYAVSEKGYVFGSINYENDRFSGYDHRVSELLGYGHKFHDNETLKTSAEISIGARQSELSFADIDGNTSEDEAVVKALGNLAWTVTDTTQFTEELSIEAGEESTISKSVSGLKVNINSSLAMKLTYTIKHTSEVPVGTRKTDSERVVTLVYSF